MAEQAFIDQFIGNVGKVFNKKSEELSLDTTFVGDLHAKSQSMWGLAALAERQCGAKVTYADLNGCATIGDAIAFMEKLMG